MARGELATSIAPRRDLRGIPLSSQDSCGRCLLQDPIAIGYVIEHDGPQRQGPFYSVVSTTRTFAFIYRGSIVSQVYEAAGPMRITVTYAFIIRLCNDMRWLSGFLWVYVLVSRERAPRLMTETRWGARREVIVEKVPRFQV